MRALLALAIPLALAVPAAGQDAGVTPRWKLAKGDAHTYRYAQTAKQELSVMGMENTVVFKMEQDFALKVTEVGADGAGTFAGTVTRVALRLEVPSFGVDVDFDSAKAPAAGAAPAEPDAIGKALGGMVGKGFTLVLAPDGAIRKVEGFSKMQPALGEADPGDPSAMILGQLARSLSDASIKADLRPLFETLPAAAVKPGGEWTTELPIPLSGMPKQGKSARTHVLRKVEGGVAEIATTGKIALVDAPEPAEAESGNPLADMLKMFELKPEKAEETAVTKFDVAAGRLRESTGTFLLDLKLVMPQGGGMPGGAAGGESDGRLRIEGKTTLTRLDAAPAGGEKF